MLKEIIPACDPLLAKHATNLTSGQSTFQNLHPSFILISTGTDDMGQLCKVVVYVCVCSCTLFILSTKLLTHSISKVKMFLGSEEKQWFRLGWKYGAGGMYYPNKSSNLHIYMKQHQYNNETRTCFKFNDRTSLFLIYVSWIAVTLPVEHLLIVHKRLWLTVNFLKFLYSHEAAIIELNVSDDYITDFLETSGLIPLWFCWCFRWVLFSAEWKSCQSWNANLFRKC